MGSTLELKVIGFDGAPIHDVVVTHYSGSTFAFRRWNGTTRIELHMQPPFEYTMSSTLIIEAAVVRKRSISNSRHLVPDYYMHVDVTQPISPSTNLLVRTVYGHFDSRSRTSWGPGRTHVMRVTKAMM
jgi:hypothetical protein